MNPSRDEERLSAGWKVDDFIRCQRERERESTSRIRAAAAPGEATGRDDGKADGAHRWTI